MKLSPLIVALDVDNLKEVEKILQRLGKAVDFYKVGLRLFTHYGPDVLSVLRRKKKKIFLDLKFHDIPNTVAEACREAVRHKVDMLSLHASGGSTMMSVAAFAAKEAAKEFKVEKPWLMGVTVLTSMDSLEELGIPRTPAEQVVELAGLAMESKLDGVICSPHEIQGVRSIAPKNFKIVTPGVRPAGTSLGDQKRITTPQEAFHLGADAVVVGRPILEAKDPLQVVKDILRK